VLSDQASGLSGVSSLLPSAASSAAQGAPAFTKERREPRGNAAGAEHHRQEHVFSKKPAAYGLGHIRRGKDYKPHDHLALEDSPEAKQHDGYFNEQANAISKGLKFVSAFKEPEPERMRASTASPSAAADTAGREAQGSPGAEDFLESLIRELQTTTKHEDGFFVYLRQNPANPQNPYDLIPFDFAELEAVQRPRAQPDNAGPSGGALEAVAELPEAAAQGRAAKNLHVISDFKRNRAKQILEQRKVFKSEYHRTDKAPRQADGPAVQLRYYTLSKKGMTTFVNSAPAEFIRIENWLAERSQFAQISQKKFFSNFRTWKVLRMWRVNILSARREQVTANLKAKLFIADPVFGKILLQHRAHCKDLEKLRVLDLQQISGDAFTLVDFQQRQMLVRELVEGTIREASDRTRDLFKGGINQILDALRTKIHKQDEMDEGQEAVEARGDSQ
jgi:hypothetical protein